MRRKIIFALCVVLVGISIMAYTSPSSADVEPTRVLLKNSYGNVVLDHKLHVNSYGVDCSTCHDALAELSDDNRMTVFHDLCIVCHQDYGVGPYSNEQCNQCHLPQTGKR